MPLCPLATPTRGPANLWGTQVLLRFGTSWLWAVKLSHKKLGLSPEPLLCTALFLGYVSQARMKTWHLFFPWRFRDPAAQSGCIDMIDSTSAHLLELPQPSGKYLSLPGHWHLAWKPHTPMTLCILLLSAASPQLYAQGPLCLVELRRRQAAYCLVSQALCYLKQRGATNWLKLLWRVTEPWYGTAPVIIGFRC